MWSDAGCSYASLQYQHAIPVPLCAGQYVTAALGDDTVDQQAATRNDQMLRQKMPQETGNDTLFQRRMQRITTNVEVVGYLFFKACA